MVKTWDQLVKESKAKIARMSTPALQQILLSGQYNADGRRWVREELSRRGANRTVRRQQRAQPNVFGFRF